MQNASIPGTLPPFPISQVHSKYNMLNISWMSDAVWNLHITHQKYIYIYYT